MTVIHVGMAEYKIAKSPDLLMTAGLGSCVAACIFDAQLQIAGLAHVMLPTTTENTRGHLNKYADVLIQAMYSDLVKKGASRTRLKAKIAGGSQMFSFAGTSQVLKIGERNIEAVKNELHKLAIPILAEDVGGNSGRTVTFDITSGLFRIRTINQGERAI